MKPSLIPDAMKNQANLGFAWEATNWNGACAELVKLAKLILVITGTDDNNYMPHTMPDISLIKKYTLKLYNETYCFTFHDFNGDEITIGNDCDMCP